MKRDLNKLSNGEFDILVIGGGIYGACIAREGASRGLSVALVEKGDFGCATSSNSLKTVHGGLRYLQSLDFIRMRESIKERSVLLSIAPHLVSPLPFLMPTRGWKKGRAVMSLAFLLNDLIGFDRNWRLKGKGKDIPLCRVVSREECIRLYPEADKEGLTGGALWHDCLVRNTERFLLSFLMSAVREGAVAANYAKAVKLLGDEGKAGGRIKGVLAEDSLDGRGFEIRAKLVINAAGPWIDDVLKLSGRRTGKRYFFPSVALNILTDPLTTSNCALGLYSSLKYADNGSRLLVLLPWRKHTLAGTGHAVYQKSADEFAVESGHIAGFLRELKSTGLDVDGEQIKYVYGGLLPVEESYNGLPALRLLTRYQIIDHKKEEELDGIITVLGVKYTTARDVAEKVINLAGLKLNKNIAASKTAETPVYGGDIEKIDDYLKIKTEEKLPGLDPSLIRRLIMTYGTAYKEIAAYIKEKPQLGKPLANGAEVTEAELVHAVKEEMALKLSDLILRRTETGTLGHPGDKVLKLYSAVIARELGWSAEREKRERDEVESHYSKMKGAVRPERLKCAG